MWFVDIDELTSATDEDHETPNHHILEAFGEGWKIDFREAIFEREAFEETTFGDKFNTFAFRVLSLTLFYGWYFSF